jgi:hypothetical protein
MKKLMSALRALPMRFCGCRGTHAAHEWSGCYCPGTGPTR